MLRELLKHKKVLICCGSGGVGKTTTSAALALYAARQGLKTIVLTIDPAKRLANSLGIQKIDYGEKQIPASELRKAGIALQAPLFAMMLDTKRTFDELILKYTENREKADAILQNKLYQHLSNMIAGSQEYMAMEKLYEITQERDYDLIVLDTPPSRHALEFLDAPKKMSEMIGNSMLKWFLKPSLFVSRVGLRWVDQSMRRVFKSFDKVAGFEFLQDLSGMLVSTSGLLEGFQERAEKVGRLLHDERTSFILISSPQPIPLREAAFFHQKINEYSLPFAGFIFNRVQLLKPEPLEASGVSATAKREYEEVRRLFTKLYERDQAELAQFREKLKLRTQSLLLQTLPQLDHDVHDLKGLMELGNLLFSEG